MRIAVILVLGLLMVGCVTTTNDPATRVNKEKSLSNHIDLGLGYLRQKNHESARLHLNKALEIDSKAPGALNGLALLYQLESQDDLAEKYFKRAIAADGSFAQVRNNYGAFLFAKERYEEARDNFKIVSEDVDYPRRPLALINLGRAELKLNKTAQAKAAFIQAVAINSQASPAFLELADIAFAEKDYPAAKAYLDQFGKLSRHSSRSLWLGIRIEAIFGNKDQEASYILALKNMFPYSSEYLEFKNSNAATE